MREGHPTVPEETRASSKSRAFSSIQGRLAGLLLLVIAPILVAQAYFSYDQYQSARRAEIEANLGLARATAKAFDTFVQDVLHQELAIGLAFTSSQPLSEKEQSRILFENQAANQAIWHFFWDSPAGLVTAATGSQFIGMDVSDREFYREIVAGKEWVVSDLLLSKTTRQPSFTISRGIRNERGELLGIIVAGILPAKLDRVLAVERPGDAGVSLLDSKGMHVYRYPAARYTWEQRNWLKLYPFLEQVAKGKEVVNAGHESKIRKGTKRIVAFTPVPSIGWIVASSRAEKETVGPIISATLQETGLILLVALISLFTAFALSRTISASVKSLRNHALSIGRGENENPLTISGPTEIKDLAEAFNKMAAEMRLREKALRESEERFRAISENQSEGLMLFNPEKNLIYQNSAALRIYSSSVDEGPVHSLTDIWQISDDQGRPIGFDEWPASRVLRGERFQNQVLHVRRQDGGVEFDASYNGCPIYDAAGTLALGFITIRDITEQKRSEEALRQRAEEVERLLEAVPAAVWVAHDPQCLSIMGNRKANEFYEAKPGENVSATTLPEPRRFFTPDGRELPAEELPMQKAVVTNQDVPDTELHVELPSGRRIAMLGSAVPLRDPQGKARGCIGAFMDITDRKKSEEALKASLSEKEVLLKEIHHRVKNNMQVISSLVDLQADEVKDPAMRAVFEDVIYRVRSMAMVHEKLYQSADLARVDFADYAQSLLGYLWRAQGATASGIRLDLNLTPVSLSVNAAVPCGLILNELFSNALKHAFKGRESGKVIVSLCEDARGRVRLGVRDDGIGLPAQMNWEQSSSLGLGIVKTLARQLRAEVRVRNAQGTEFTLQFER